MNLLRNYFKKIGPTDISAFALIMLFTIFFSFVGLARHFSLLTSINDLGHFDQAVWGSIQDGVLLNSDVFNFKINHLGFHFTPILYAFSPLYKLLPTAIWLILAQAFCTAIAAWPIYLITANVSSSKFIALLWSMIFLFNPFLQNAVAWDFHPVMLTLPFIGFAIYFLLKNKFLPVVICSIIIMMCKEHFGIMTAGFGLLWYVKHRDLKKSFLLCSIGILEFLLVFEYLMPLLSPTGNHLMISKGFGQLSRYSWLGDSPSEIILSILKNPYKVFQISILKMGGGGYLILLLIPFLFLPILELPLLIPTIADLAANILSANQMPRSVYAYHSAPLIPFLCISAVYASRKLSDNIKRFTLKDVSFFVMFATLILSYVLTPYPFPKSANFWAPKNFSIYPSTTLKKVQSILKPSISLSSQANIGAHFTQRELIFTFPNKIGEADAVVLQLESPTTNLTPNTPFHLGTLASHLQMTPNKYLDTILEILSEGKYGIILWEGNWLVLKKDSPDLFSASLVKKRIFQLREKWESKKSLN
jgi:uncharacterized membrane protein